MVYHDLFLMALDLYAVLFDTMPRLMCWSVLSIECDRSHSMWLPSLGCKRPCIFSALSLLCFWFSVCYTHTHTHTFLPLSLLDLRKASCLVTIIHIEMLFLYRNWCLWPITNEEMRSMRAMNQNLGVDFTDWVGLQMTKFPGNSLITSW